MTEPAIQTSHLSLHFGNHKVLHDLSIDVPAGSIYGFIGHNGAGKTTTIKVLLSLLQNFTGHAFIHGMDVTKKRIEALSLVGSLVEAPGLYQHLSGQENLNIRAMLLGISSKRVTEVLNIVGLWEARNKLVKRYSHGMKQRLGIALALIPNPQLLILDEPTNGLDPSGMKEVRELLTSLAGLGKSIFISSHILSEVEKIITRVGIIHKGKLLFQGTVDELKLNSTSIVEFEVVQHEKAIELLMAKEITHQDKGNVILVPFDSVNDIAELANFFFSHSLSLIGIKRIEKSLEELFFDLVAKENQAL